MKKNGGRSKTQKPVCFIACTHGDEPIGQAVMDRLSKDSRYASLFDVVIGNPKALQAKKRYLEADLNRSAPGTRRGKVYEQRRAYELMRQLKSYHHVVDLHETHANDRVILILMKLTPQILALASIFPVTDVLYWPSQKKTGPITQYVSSGLEVESGTKTSFEKTRRRLERVLKTFLSRLDSIPAQEALFRKHTILPPCKRFFYVYDTIKPGDISSPSRLKDFHTVRTSKESFVALLFGRYAGLIGYKMRPIDAKWIAAHRDG